MTDEFPASTNFGGAVGDADVTIEQFGNILGSIYEMEYIGYIVWKHNVQPKIVGPTPLANIYVAADIGYAMDRDDDTRIKAVNFYTDWSNFTDEIITAHGRNGSAMQNQINKLYEMRMIGPKEKTMLEGKLVRGEIMGGGGGV